MTTVAHLNGHSNPTAAADLAEAPVSINVFAQFPGQERMQVTARGLTGAEAASRLRESLDALQAVFAPRPACPACGGIVEHTLPLAECTACLLAAQRVLSRQDQIGMLLARSLTCAVAKGDLALADRLGKAAVLVLSGAVEPTDSPAVMAVRSQRDPLTWYEVSGTVCTCKDSVRHVQAGERHLCKHALAAMMVAKLSE